MKGTQEARLSRFRDALVVRVVGGVCAAALTLEAVGGEVASAQTIRSDPAQDVARQRDRQVSLTAQSIARKIISQWRAAQSTVETFPDQYVTGGSDLAIEAIGERQSIVLDVGVYRRNGGFDPQSVFFAVVTSVAMQQPGLLDSTEVETLSRASGAWVAANGGDKQGSSGKHRAASDGVHSGWSTPDEVRAAALSTAQRAFSGDYTLVAPQLPYEARI